MFDLLRNLTKSAEEKRQETVAAYVDGVLNGRSRQQFEQEMAQDDALRLEVEQLLLIKQSLRQLPQREVPRNFLLDPAEFSHRPDPQPWVRGYPMLRTATAMAAFFFIFAIAAGIFTGFGLGSEPSLAPAANVAQVEEVVETRVVAEAPESLAFEAESVAEEAIVEEEGAAAEALADEAAADEAAPPEEQAADAASQSEASQSDVAEDGGAAASPQATALAPTPTASTLPRVTPPTPLPERDLELPAGSDAAAAEMSEPAVENDLETAETTAVSPEENSQASTIDQPANALLWLQIGLGGLLLLLVSLTFYARRQR